MNKPKISVIMPNYNGERYLAEAIESILNQTFSNFEFIIIDDGSTDHSVKIIKSYLKKDKRIKFLINKKNLGLIKTLNLGLRIAKGKYVARMDCDDVSLPERLNIELNYLENNPDIFLVGGSFILIKENGEVLFQVNSPISKESMRKKLANKNVIIHPSVMFRNERGITYREKAIYCEDYDLWLRLLRKGKNLVILKEVLLKYRIRGDSICNSKTKQQKLFTQEILNWDKNISVGKDEGYDNFDPKIILNKEYDNFLPNKIGYISILFRGRKMQEVRKEIKKLWEEIGFFKSGVQLPVYFITSFMPKPITTLAINLLNR